MTSNRVAEVRRGQLLTYVTIAYNILEGAVAIGLGVITGSIVLVGFGFDSVIELGASLVALWRLAEDQDPRRRQVVERISRRIIGLSFILLAAYVACESTLALWYRRQPEESPIGIVLAIVSLMVMPFLARAKRQVAADLKSAALRAEAQQTLFCTYLSGILLAGLGLHSLVGWWWADPVAALVMVPIIAREGVEGLRGRETCD